MIRNKLVTHLLVALSVLSPATFLFPEKSLATTRIASNFVVIAPFTSQNIDLTCPSSNPFVYSGGPDSLSPAGRGFYLVDSYAIANSTWGIRLYNPTSLSQSVRLVVVCGNGT